jgi:hypothetical protein
LSPAAQAGTTSRLSGPGPVAQHLRGVVWVPLVQAPNSTSIVKRPATSSRTLPSVSGGPQLAIAQPPTHRPRRDGCTPARIPPNRAISGSWTMCRAPGPSVAMTTTNNSLALSLLALVWVHRDRTQPRKWFHWGAMLGGAHHVTVYSDRLRDRDFYTARESGSKTYGWVMVIELLPWNGKSSSIRK